jgi:alkyl sulfatase BDS1-like metallo-beta-lactamase superfamily hydrolase
LDDQIGGGEVPVYRDSDQLYQALRMLFDQLQVQPATIQAVNKSRLAIRFNLTAPSAQVLINGRVNTPKIHYGVISLRPDLEVDLSADAFHQILLRELRLSKALGSGVMKVRGPVWKTFALEEILHQCQDFYPEVAREMGLGSHLK